MSSPRPTSQPTNPTRQPSPAPTEQGWVYGYLDVEGLERHQRNQLLDKSLSWLLWNCAQFQPGEDLYDRKKLEFVADAEISSPASGLRLFFQLMEALPDTRAREIRSALKVAIYDNFQCISDYFNDLEIDGAHIHADEHKSVMINNGAPFSAWNALSPLQDRPLWEPTPPTDYVLAGTIKITGFNTRRFDVFQQNELKLAFTYALRPPTVDPRLLPERVVFLDCWYVRPDYKWLQIEVLLDPIDSEHYESVEAGFHKSISVGTLTHHILQKFPGEEVDLQVGSWVQARRSTYPRLRPEVQGQCPYPDGPVLMQDVARAPDEEPVLPAYAVAIISGTITLLVLIVHRWLCRTRRVQCVPTDGNSMVM